MKIHAVSIVLLLTASALAGCAGSSDTDHEISGTSWIIMIQIDGYDARETLSELGEYAITVKTFEKDGESRDYHIAGFNSPDDGCPYGTVAQSENELLCGSSMDMDMGMGNTWRVDDNGHLDISTTMLMSGEWDDEIDEMECNMMALDMGPWESHYSTETNYNWLENENACEMEMVVKMKVILSDEGLVIHRLHPIGSEEQCIVGIEWTGKLTQVGSNPNALTESEIDTFDALLNQCPEPIPWDAVVWECELNVRFASLAELSAQSYNESISDHPGYPEWCGRVVPDNLALDGSESNLPPAEEMYGIITDWWMYARNETHWMDSWFEQEDCNNEGEYWDEKYGMCAMPVGCPTEADSQLIYEECIPWQWARYHWSGDYLYIGMPSDRWM
tara:strand:+ start:311 stop:1477 length:1167 start_codon:yes stop_codon:yes gene_type:complete